LLLQEDNELKLFKSTKLIVNNALIKDYSSISLYGKIIDLNSLNFKGNQNEVLDLLLAYIFETYDVDVNKNS